jgi:hypothetical protein
MKINRLVVFLYLIFFLALGWLGVDSHYDISYEFQEIQKDGNVTVDGVLNIAAIYCFIMIIIPIIPFVMLSIITGKQVNWLPKICFQFYGVIVACGFLYGIYQHFHLVSQIEQHGYIECKDDRFISSKYSSRTYALTLEKCKIRRVE